MAADQESGGQAAVTAVADGVRDLVRAVRKSKARVAAEDRDDVESATHAVLHVARRTGRCGPAPGTSFAADDIGYRICKDAS